MSKLNFFLLHFILPGRPSISFSSFVSISSSSFSRISRLFSRIVIIFCIYPWAIICCVGDPCRSLFVHDKRKRKFSIFEICFVSRFSHFLLKFNFFLWTHGWRRRQGTASKEEGKVQSWQSAKGLEICFPQNFNNSNVQWGRRANNNRRQWRWRSSNSKSPCWHF